MTTNNDIKNYDNERILLRSSIIFRKCPWLLLSLLMFVEAGSLEKINRKSILLPGVPSRRVQHVVPSAFSFSHSNNSLSNKRRMQNSFTRINVDDSLRIRTSKRTWSSLSDIANKDGLSNYKSPVLQKSRKQRLSSSPPPPPSTIKLQTDISTAIRQCSSILQLQTLLLNTTPQYINRSLPSTKATTSSQKMKNHHLGQLLQTRIQTTLGPNVATVALRKLVELLSSRDHNKQGHKKSYNVAMTSNLWMVEILLEYIDGAVSYDLSELQLTLKEGKDDAMEDLRKVQLNEYSLMNIMISMAKLTILQKQQQHVQRKNHQNDSSSVTSSTRRRSDTISPLNPWEDLLKQHHHNNKQKHHGIKSTSLSLTDKVCQIILLSSSSNKIPKILQRVGPTRLVGLLSSMAALQMQHQTELLEFIGTRLQQGDAMGQLTSTYNKSKNNNNSKKNHDGGRVRPQTQYQSPNALVSVLCAYTQLNTMHYQLYQAFMRRLRKKKVRENLKIISSNDICRVVWAVGRSMQDYLEHSFGDDNGEEEYQERGLGGRFSTFQYDKRDQHKTLSFIDSSYPCPSPLEEQYDEENKAENDFHQKRNILWEEAETMCYTLLGELVKRDDIDMTASSNIDTTGTHNIDNSKQPSTATALPSTIQSLSGRQVADILSSCAIFEFRPDAKILEKVMNAIGSTSYTTKADDEDHTIPSIASRCTVADIARMMRSLQQLPAQDPDYDDYEDEYDYEDATNNAVIALARRFQYLLLQQQEQKHQSSSTTICDAKTMTIILRGIMFLLPPNSPVTNILLQDLYDPVVTCLMDDAFLSQSNEYEVSNFIWFLAKVKARARTIDNKGGDRSDESNDKELLQKLATRMRSSEVLARCSPNSASRFLWSMTTLVEQFDRIENVDTIPSSDLEDDNSENKGTDEVVGTLQAKELLFEMFQSLGGILLTPELSVVDCSNTMWAIAKSSYSFDLGIFDHLAKVLSREQMLKEATVQQISIALWSCGKMFEWEDPLREIMEYGEVRPPPYSPCAKKFATFLISSRDQMSSKDVAQVCWSLGRLKIKEFYLVAPFASLAVEMAETPGREGDCCFNSQELANIIWGLSKTNYRDERGISKLTKKMRDPIIQEQCTSQEAANVLYALGRMNIRDKATFSCMTKVIMRQLNGATTQTIANALWAHDCVNLYPPQQLFDNWAKEKLDLVGVYLDNVNKVHAID